ncbi:hypothetical protein CPB86DRAFT_820515 [Serendipita vermifera]|nr:hypothetical protein CPB86DRAFT_820515 [Serendipita vermifera]
MQLLESPTPVPFNAVPQTLPRVPTPTPTSTSMRIATPMASRTTINIPNVIAPPIANNFSPMTNTLQPSGANNPASTTGNTVHLSVPATETTPQVRGDDDVKTGNGFRITIVSVGSSTTLTVVTEILLGADLVGSNPETSAVFGTQAFIEPSVTPAHARNNDLIHSGLFPAVIGPLVGSLLSATTLWILFVVWLKKRKKAREFKELGDATSI